MTITLPLAPQDEARLLAAAKARGVSADELVREAIDSFLSIAPRNEEARDASGAALLAAMQASPYKEISIEPGRHRLPVRDVRF